MSEEINLDQLNEDRRRFMRNAAMTIAAAEFMAIGSAVAEPSNKKPINTTPAPLGMNPSSASTFARESRSMPAY